MVRIRVTETAVFVVQYGADELRNLLQVTGSEAQIAEFIDHHHPHELLRQLHRTAFEDSQTSWHVEVNGVPVGGK